MKVSTADTLADIIIQLGASKEISTHVGREKEKMQYEKMINKKTEKE